MIKVFVNGASGKMGREAVQAINSDPELELVGTGGRNDDLQQLLVSLKPEVVVDLTVSDVVYRNTKTIIEQQIHPVIGTSGLLPEQVLELQALASEQKLGGIIAPNFSIGAVLMMQMSKLAAKYFPCAEIIEYHHPAKQDAPSGTAIKTAELIAQNRQATPTAVQSEEIIAGARGATLNEVPIHAVRLPGIVANQQVLFSGEHELLSIKHGSYHRQAFMPGIILCIKAVQDAKQLHYGLEQLI